MPFCNTVCISHKIYDHNERMYLSSLAMLLKPAVMGLFVRSSAQGISEDAIVEDFNDLKKQWNFIQKAAISISFPALIYKDEDLVQKTVRDYYEDNIQKIIIDSQDGLRQLRYHLDRWKCISPLTYVKLQLYRKPECMLEQFQIKNTILDALKPKVQLSSGGYIIIENNEALTVIDVNSGSFNASDNSKEAILHTNCYAAIEIAYQLRIRNINGVIIVDFIDMQSQQDQLQLLEHFSNLLKLDNARPQIVQLSELGLVELTRRRRGQSLFELCNGKSHPYLKGLANYLDFSSKMHRHWAKDFMIHQNIKLLFFSKKFTSSITLATKKNSSRKDIISKHAFYLDKINKVNLLKPRANYVIPLLFYSFVIGINGQTDKK